ncbi:MAG TPA: polysaccharide deacetylase family protein [Ignavibacteriaceae bacterium]|nr:polysaccharide deacetylase family protein [Ignavibacteriaceae bacterium]
MAIVDKNRFRSHIFFLFLTGLIVLIFSALVYLLIIRTVYGRFSASQLVPNAKAVNELLFGTFPSTAILNSDYTKNILAEQSSWFDDNLKTWQKSLRNLDIKYQHISDEDVELGRIYDYHLIVLSGCKSLSEREVIQLKKYLENGGSIFATGGTGSYSEDGKWRGWDFLSDVFGITFRKEIGNDDRTKIHTLRGGLPITANIPTGFPLNIATWDHPIAAEILDPRTTQVSFWYNHQLEDGLVREGIKETAGIVYGNYGKGRFVWMGFEINSVLGRQDDYVYFDRLFNNCISWLTYKPIAYLRNWPNGYRGAAMLAPVISDSLQNINYLLSVLGETKTKATFFVNPSMAGQDPQLIKSLVNYGEVAAFINFEFVNTISDNNNLLNTISDDKKLLEKITGSSVEGIYPSANVLSESTLKTLMASGFKYFISDSLDDRSVPKTIKRKDEKIISISRTVRDDYEVIRDFNLTERDFQFYSYQEDVDRIAFESGLYLFKMHMDYQCSPQNIEVVRDLIRDIKSKDYWIATASEIAEWSDKKDFIELRTQKRGSSRVAVTITNFGSFNINYLVVDVDLNQKAERVSLDTEIIGTKKAQYKHKDGSQFVFMLIDELAAGESRTYYIDYDKYNL